MGIQWGSFHYKALDLGFPDTGYDLPPLGSGITNCRLTILPQALNVMARSNIKRGSNRRDRSGKGKARCHRCPNFRMARIFAESPEDLLFSGMI
jgi:hypothetical protein